MRASDLESLLAADHRARLVWGYVVRQDLGKLFDAVKARGSNAGLAAIDPRILFALWLHATLEGVGSGRELARRTPERGRRAGSHPQGAGQERPRPDPDARVMKMGDGGFRPAVNVQFATTCSEQVIVGMDAVKAGSDMAQLAQMVEQVE